MSIRFPSDDNAGMSRRNAPRKRGGGGVFFLMMVGVVAFMLMRGLSSSGPAAPADSNPVDPGEVIQYRGLQQPPQQKERAQRADQGDWGMEDGPVQKNASSKTPSSGSSKSQSSNGDWGMEGVTSTKREQPTNHFSQPSSGSVETTPKKPATQGDWGLDTDVEAGAKPAAPKKSTQGDWGMEQVE